MQSEAFITERDVQVVLDVYKYRYLTVEQVLRLHFPSRQTANRRLRVLLEEGYLEAYRVPAVEDRILHIAPKGAEIVASALRMPVHELPGARVSHAAKDYYFLRHFLELNDFRITLHQALSAQSEVTLLGFIPEHYGERTTHGGWVRYVKDVVCDIRFPSERIAYTPDGVFALERGGKAALFFVEIDRGTETLSDPEKGFLKALRFYYNYLLEGGYQRYVADFGCEPVKSFRVLYVTTSPTRVANMRAAASQLDIAEKRFIWLTSAEQVRRETVLQPIWQSAEAKDTNLYRIA